MAERIAYRILGGIAQRDKTRDLAIQNIEIIAMRFFASAIRPLVDLSLRRQPISILIIKAEEREPSGFYT